MNGLAFGIGRVAAPGSVSNRYGIHRHAVWSGRAPAAHAAVKEAEIAARAKISFDDETGRLVVE